MEPGPDAEWSELSTNLGWLFLGSLTAQALSYSAALGVLVLARAPAERDAAADFIVGFFLARIPILLFQAVQAALLPEAGRPRRARASTTTSAPACASSCSSSSASACSASSAAPPSARPSARSCSATSSTSTAVDLALLFAGQRAVHPRPHARAGVDRAARPRSRAHRLGRRPRRLRRRHGARQLGTDDLFLPGRARLPRRLRARAALMMALLLLGRAAHGSARRASASSSSNRARTARDLIAHR